jgi:hypothetical protein
VSTDHERQATEHFPLRDIDAVGEERMDAIGECLAVRH